MGYLICVIMYYKHNDKVKKASEYLESKHLMKEKIVSTKI